MIVASSAAIAGVGCSRTVDSSWLFGVGRLADDCPGVANRANPLRKACLCRGSGPLGRISCCKRPADGTRRDQLGARTPHHQRLRQAGRSAVLLLAAPAGRRVTGPGAWPHYRRRRYRSIRRTPVSYTHLCPDTVAEFPATEPLRKKVTGRSMSTGSGAPA